MAEVDHALDGTHNVRPPSSGDGFPPKPVAHLTANGGLLNDDCSFGNPRKKAHKKSPSVFKDSDDTFVPNGNGLKQVAMNKSRRDSVEIPAKDQISDKGHSSIPLITGVRPYVPAPPSTVSNLTTFSTLTNGSGSSSGSGSTVRTSSFSRRDDATTATKTKNKQQRRTSVKKPNALNFLDSDSPELTPEVIQQSIETAPPHRAPGSPQSISPSNRSTSSTSSGFRDDASDIIGDHETDRSTSPERSINGEDKGQMRTPVAARIDTRQARRRSYGTPDMPYAGVNQPYMSSPNAATPRAPNQGPFMFPPRPDRPPLSGYELLASRLCSGAPSDHNGPPLKPIYRRFEALNHRILLHLQDEICDLEEQLHRLDSTDTQNRRLPSCILPASRRADQHSGTELHWHRLDILSKIGFKLEQYNNVLSSFRKTQFYSASSLPDVYDYRAFLSTHAPIVEAETHFLDAPDDLICVAEESEGSTDGGGDDSRLDSADEDAVPTPMMVPSVHFNLRDLRQQQHQQQPQAGGIASELTSTAGFAPQQQQPQASAEQVQGEERRGGVDKQLNLLSLAIGIAGAILLPVLAFAAIPGFVGRMAVVFVVLVGGVGGLLQGNFAGLGMSSTADICICAGCYGAVMAVLAGVMA